LVHTTCVAEQVAVTEPLKVTGEIKVDGGPEGLRTARR